MSRSSEEQLQHVGGTHRPSRGRADVAAGVDAPSPRVMRFPPSSIVPRLPRLPARDRELLPVLPSGPTVRLAPDPPHGRLFGCWSSCRCSGPLAARDDPAGGHRGRADQISGLDAQVDEVVRTLDVFLGYATFRDELGGNPRRGSCSRARRARARPTWRRPWRSRPGSRSFRLGPGVPVVFFGDDRVGSGRSSRRCARPRARKAARSASSRRSTRSAWPAAARHGARPEPMDGLAPVSNAVSGGAGGS